MFAYIVSPVVAMFLVGFFWPRCSARGAFIGLVSGHALAALIFVLVQAGVLALHFLYVSGLLFAASALLCILGSLALGPAPVDARTRDLTFSQRDRTPARANQLAFYADPRYQAAAVVLLTALVVFLFR